jgi:hypothetical protein
MLIDSLPKGVVRWCCCLRKVGEIDKLYFDHGIETGFGLIIGAEGAWSKIRPLLTDDEPHYVGLGGIALRISDPEEICPNLYKIVNRDSLFCLSDGKGLQPQ